VVADAKTLAWEEFGEAMEFGLASRMIWQNIRWLGKGKPGLPRTFLSGGRARVTRRPLFPDMSSF